MEMCARAEGRIYEELGGGKSMAQRHEVMKLPTSAYLARLAEARHLAKPPDKNGGDAIYRNSYVI